jgi:hypothetical protein
MLFNAAVQSQGAYLLVTTSGPAELPELCALADFPAAVARRRGCKRALFDLLALRPILTPPEHVELGEHIASTLAGFERIAVVLADPADWVAANAAAAKGLPLRTFSTLHEAEEWLSE